MRRRELITLLGGGAVAAWPLAARAQQAALPVVGFLNSAAPDLPVASLSRPGGNMTGATQLNMEVASKRLEIFHELIPAATDCAHLVNPADPIVAEIGIRDSDAAARALGLKLHVLNAASEAEFEKVFATVAQRRLGGLVVGVDILFTGWSRQLGALAARYGVPRSWRQNRPRW